MPNPVIQVLMAALQYLGKLLPADVQPLVNWVVGLLGGLDIGPTDPRTAQVAELVRGLIADLIAMDGMEGGVRDRARLIAENRFGKAWIASGLSGGGI